MISEPYASAKTVFWIVDNGSSHAGRRSIERLAGRLSQRAPDPPADPRLVAEPDRDLLLDPATQGADPQRLRRPRRARRPHPWRSRTTTARSPSRSNGPSPAPTSTRCSPGSPLASRSCDSPPDATPPTARRAGVRATPARTATAWITLAHNNCRDPLARSISATAANRRPQPPASRSAITARASRARSTGVSSSSSTSSSTASPASSSSSAIASHNRPNAGESNFGSSTCNDKSRHGRSTNSASNIANSRSLNAPAEPATPRAAPRKNASAKLSCDGPRATPQQRLTFRPLPHEHNALRPIFAIAASSRQHRSEPTPHPTNGYRGHRRGRNPRILGRRSCQLRRARPDRADRRTGGVTG